MSKTPNGWPIIESQSDPKLAVIRIPGTRRAGVPLGIPLRVQKDCAPLLAYVASRVHNEVCDLHTGNKPGKIQDEGGYNYRKIDGTNRFSNHASGTAIDLNWTRWPMFRKAMSKKERAAAQAIADDLAEVITWGGSWTRRVDEMHWEIKNGVKLTDVRKFLKARGIRKDGTVSPNHKLG